MSVKICIGKPTFPETSLPHGQVFWDSVLKECEKFGKVDVVNVRFGLYGITQAKNHYSKNKSDYDLFVMHHLKYSIDKVIDFKTAYYPNLWYFDNNGYSGFSDLHKMKIEDHDINVCKNHFKNYVEPLMNTTKYENKNKGTIEKHIPKNFILVACQVERDTVMKFKKISTVDMIKRASEVGEQMGLPVVVKRHPYGKRDAKMETIVRKNKNIFFTESNIRDLIERSSAVFVINSGVGFESLIRMKPVFTFGKSDYNQVTFDDYSTDQIVEQMSKPIDEDMIYRYFYQWWSNIIDINQPSFERDINNKIKNKLGMFVDV